jgi:4-aminobutyrate aminotransferase-like enzyme
MSDNCQNHWGTVLAVCSTKHLGESSYADERVLRDNITATFRNKYVLSKVMSCGSDANMDAVMSASNGDTNAMLIAAGSYVSGDNGTMQTFSTSDFSLGTGFSGIAHPSKVRNEFTRKQTVAFPYFIEGTIDRVTQKTYENKCIKQLHLRCLLAIVKKRPIWVILLELMLASNGTSLSDRFLTMLGKFASCFGIRFIVDEIMTAGRTGKMLMLQHKPDEFQSQVTHVTLGKWTQKGLVLVSREFYEHTLEQSTHTEYRMLSHHIDCRDVLLHWTSVRKNLSKHDKVRKKVLAKLKMKEEVTWGKGTLMFAPIKKRE